jgi:hypothetical protein
MHVMLSHVRRWYPVRVILERVALDFLKKFLERVLDRSLTKREKKKLAEEAERLVQRATIAEIDRLIAEPRRHEIDEAKGKGRVPSFFIAIPKKLKPPAKKVGTKCLMPPSIARNKTRKTMRGTKK